MSQFAGSLVPANSHASWVNGRFGVFGELVEGIRAGCAEWRRFGERAGRGGTNRVVRGSTTALVLEGRHDID